MSDEKNALEDKNFHTLRVSSLFKSFGKKSVVKGDRKSVV